MALCAGLRAPVHSIPATRPLHGLSEARRGRALEEAPRCIAAAATAAAATAMSGRSRGRRSVEPPRALKPSITFAQRSLEVNETEAYALVEEIRSFAVARDGDDATGTRTKHWTQRLCRGLEAHPGLRPLLQEEGGVEAALLELETRSAKHTEMFKGITEHHAALREGNAADAEEYSEQAAYMAEQWWIRIAKQRIISLIDQYYLLTGEQMRRGHPRWAFPRESLTLPKGWVKYEVKGRTLYWNPEKMKMETRAPVPAEGKEPPSPRDPPVRLLDIGSNTNSFREFPFHVTPYALDLQPNPAAEGVFQADFFDVPIVEAPDAEEPLILDEDGKLKGIVAGSMDVVVICLVLSFLPTPEKRIEMVAKARKCLRDDRGMLFVVEGAAAIVEASWHHEDEAAEWSKAMESAGFKALLYSDIVNEGRRKKCALQWALETAPVTDGELKTLRIAKEMEF